MNREKKQRRGLGWDSFKRKGRALSGEHMKGRVCHLGALMTGCVSLFWLKISFNMHDKRRLSGTLPGDSAASPLQTPAASALHRFIISGSYLTAWTRIPHRTLSLPQISLVCWNMCTKAHKSWGNLAKTKHEAFCTHCNHPYWNCTLLFPCPCLIFWKTNRCKEH